MKTIKCPKCGHEACRLVRYNSGDVWMCPDCYLGLYLDHTPQTKWPEKEEHKKQSDKKTIKIYCGETIQKHCREQRHPVAEVRDVERLVKASHDVIAYSNNPDFVMAMKYIAKKEGITPEFFINGVSCGNDIGPVFNDFNRSLDLINELGATEE